MVSASNFSPISQLTNLVIRLLKWLLWIVVIAFAAFLPWLVDGWMHPEAEVIIERTRRQLSLIALGVPRWGATD